MIAGIAVDSSVVPRKMASTVINVDSGVVPRVGSAGSDKPWRKPAKVVKAERERTRQLLGNSGGVDLQAVKHYLAVQEVIDTSVSTPSVEGLQAAATKLLQVATNAEQASEVSKLRVEVDAAVEKAGLAATLKKRQQRGSGAATSAALKKLQLMHEVVPRLWVGGWAALNNECTALKERRVTHVLSVLSAEQRRLPAFVREHMHLQVDDRDEAAETLASHFEAIARFVDNAARLCPLRLRARLRSRPPTPRAAAAAPAHAVTCRSHLAPRARSARPAVSSSCTAAPGSLERRRRRSPISCGSCDCAPPTPSPSSAASAVARGRMQASWRS